MEPLSFEFTPEQKNLLESFSRETGKSMPLLITKALHLRYYINLRTPDPAALPCG